MLRVVDRVMRRGWGDKVGRDELGSLMDELVEGVLAVGARRAPDYWLWGKKRRQLGYGIVKAN